MERKDFISYALYFSLVFILLTFQVAWGMAPQSFLEPGFKYIQSVYHYIGETIGDFRQIFVSRGQLASRLEELSEVETELTLRTRQLDLVQQENQRLRRRFDLPSARPGHLQAAEVIQSNLGGWERTLRLNRGYAAGIQAEYPLLQARGDTWILRGKIYSVSEKSSRAVLTDDPRFKIGVQIEGIADRQFVLRGDGYDRLLISDFPDFLEVKIGAKIITAPASSIAPPGLLLGKIKEAKSSGAGRVGLELVAQPIEYDVFPDLLWVLRTND